MKRYSLLLLFFSVFLPNLFAQDNSILSNGKWYKIATNNNGIYKLTYSDFQALGVSVSSLQISAIKLFGNGGGMLPKLNSDFRYSDLIENAIKVHDSNNNGIFESGDYILFYGMSANVWSFNDNTNLFEHTIHHFANEVDYFITIDNQIQGKRIEQGPELQSATKTITSYNAYAYHEEELENIIHSGNVWLGERFDQQNNQTFSFTFPNLIKSSDLNIKVRTVSRSVIQSDFNVQINASSIGIINIPQIAEYGAEFAKSRTLNTTFSSSSDNVEVGLSFISQHYGATGWLDYIEINGRRELKLSEDYFNFRDIENSGNEIGEYVINNAKGVVVWDVTNPTDVKKMQTSFVGDILSFKDSLIALHEYIAFNSSAYLSPTLKGGVSNQNIHNTPADVEFIIVSHPNFVSAANRLADFHDIQDNIKTIVVTPQHIYNEFSSGMQDVSAIRDFIKFQYDKENSGLKYLLLFGDGSYDPKNRIEDNTNYIPTFQSDNSLHKTESYVTDDYFGLLDDNEGIFNNDLVDIGIGRFPVTSLSDANLMVDKIEQYYKYSTFGSWRNKITFVADDGDGNDGNTFMWQSDSLANIIADNYDDINIQKIYLDNYLQESTPGGNRSPDAQNAITNSITKGALLVNYTGHGGELGWSNERILEIKQINDLVNYNNVPLFMTATCNFSHFDNPEYVSAGEQLLLNANGGAIALFSTSRAVYSGPNYTLNTKFINTILEKENGEFQRLGDIFKTTKVLSGISANNRNFTLLGDPALGLAYPKYDVVTSVINDTLKALGEVTIEGQIEDNGVFLSDFNGTIFPTVFDKEIIRTTLGQESCTPMPYRDQSNILYKGSATVNDGKFSFSFIVPKDIAYNYGAGKISYYAINDDELSPADANGSEEDFVIGGTADDITYDYDEAELSLFMNDRLFKDGGITDSNPILLADVFDLSGINTVGNGIGHDITAVLDGNTTNPYVLNDFYEAEKDDYTRGVIRFPFYNLEKGEHIVTLKVWDVFNNSSEVTINFVVAGGDNLEIADFTTYPNPFSNTTDIYFQHNKANNELDYVLEIYSITGVLVKRIEQSAYNSVGYRIGPIRWNGKNEYGGQISAGMYIATLGVTDEDGNFSSKSTRIILLP